MYKLNVTYKASDKEAIHEFYDDVTKAKIINKTRSEEGNLCYDYFFSAERENELLLVEKWVNVESQEIHDTLPHIILLEKIKRKYNIITSFEEV